MQRRGKRKRTALKRSFIVTFSILILLFIATYVYVYQNSVPVKHIPASLPVYEAPWARYIPNNVIQFAYQNFSYVKQLNSSLPFFAVLLHITSPSVKLTSDNVTYFVSMEFGVPNASVDFAFLNPASFAVFSSSFAGQSNFGHQVGKGTIYQVADTASGKTVVGWLALDPADKAVGFAPGFDAAQTAITDAMMVQTETNASIIQLPEIRQMLYVGGGAKGHIAVGLTGFTGDLSTALKTMTFVDSAGPRLNLSRVVQFPDSSTAYDQYSAVRHAYLAATNVIVFDAFVRASQLDSLSKLSGDYRIVL